MISPKLYSSVWGAIVAGLSGFGWVEGAVAGVVVYIVVNGVWPHIKWAWLKRRGLQVKASGVSRLPHGKSEVEVHITPRVACRFQSFNVRFIPTRSIASDARQFDPENIKIERVETLETKERLYKVSEAVEDSDGGITCRFAGPRVFRRDSILPVVLTIAVNAELVGFLSVMADIEGRSRLRGRAEFCSYQFSE